MTWLTLNDAVDSVVVKASRVGAHVFYDPKMDRFSIAEGSKNRGEIKERIEEAADLYKGYYRGYVEFNDVVEDLNYVAEECGNKGRHNATSMG